VLTTNLPEKIAILLDNSASMQTVQGEKSRFEIAKQKTRHLLGSLAPDTRVSLFLTVPGLDPIGAELNPGEALGLMEPLSPYDLGEPQGEYEQFLSRLSKESRYDRIVFFTDYRVREPGGSTEVISVGESQGNVAITSFALTRSFASDRLQATVEVTNFDSKVRKVKISLKGDGKTLSSKTPTIAARKTATVFFAGFPYGSYYEAELQLRDALSLGFYRMRIKGTAVRNKDWRYSTTLLLKSCPRTTPCLSFRLRETPWFLWEGPYLSLPSQIGETPIRSPATSISPSFGPPMLGHWSHRSWRIKSLKGQRDRWQSL
jgi:hypothetical protein